MIPLATTTLTVTRDESNGQAADPGEPYDPYDPSGTTPTVVAAGVRATIGVPSATVGLAGGDRVAYSAKFVADPSDIEPADTVTDTAGTVWSVLWARQAGTFGLGHTEGELRLVTGAV